MANETTNPNILVVAASKTVMPSREQFTLFFDTENLNHLTAVKNIAGVKTFYDYEVPFTGGIVYKGTIDASTNPNFPAAIVGDMYKVSVAGTICGIPVNVGDTIISTAIQAAGCVPADWSIIDAQNTDWQLDGNGVTAEKFIGTTTAFAFPIRTNNVERARFLSTGEFGYGTASPLVEYDVRGESQFWFNTTAVNPVVDLADRSMSVEFTGVLDAKTYIVGLGGTVNYTDQTGIESGGIYGIFGLAYVLQTSAFAITGVANQPVFSGAAAKVWIANTGSVIPAVAGHTSLYANPNPTAFAVTDSYGYWAGWDNIVHTGTTDNYTGYFLPDLSAIVGVPAATNRWGIRIEDPVQNAFMGSVGIGTLTPAYELEVVGDANATAYYVGGVAGASFSGAVTNITVVNGIVTAAS